MENLPKTSFEKVQKTVNPKTKAAHKKDLIIQILIPFILLFIAIISMVIWLAVNKIGTSYIWADIVVILTSVPIMVVNMIFIIVIIGIVFLTVIINREIPPITYKTQLAIFKIKSQVERGADVSAMPLIQIKSYLATIDAIFALFKGKNE